MSVLANHLPSSTDLMLLLLMLMLLIPHPAGRLAKKMLFELPQLTHWWCWFPLLNYVYIWPKFRVFADTSLNCCRCCWFHCVDLAPINLIGNLADRAADLPINVSDISAHDSWPSQFKLSQSISGQLKCSWLVAKTWHLQLWSYFSTCRSWSTKLSIELRVSPAIALAGIEISIEVNSAIWEVGGKIIIINLHVGKVENSTQTRKVNPKTGLPEACQIDHPSQPPVTESGQFWLPEYVNSYSPFCSLPRMINWDAELTVQLVVVPTTSLWILPTIWPVWSLHSIIITIIIIMIAHKKTFALEVS